jgi:hypothetical protein
MTRVVNKRTHSATPDDVYIGRPGLWGNPFSHLDGAGQFKVVSREVAVDLYRHYLWSQINDGEVKLEDLAALNGKTLVCWCKPAACHGDVLTKAAQWASEQLQSQPQGDQRAEGRISE